MKRFLIFAMSFAVSVTAFAQTAPPREPAPVDTVSVTGTARVTTTPDRFSFNVAESVFNQRDAAQTTSSSSPSSAHHQGESEFYLQYKNTF